jgi:hypothetical protein
MQTTLVNQLKVIAGVRIPDSPVAKQATDLLPEYGTTFIYNHSLRFFYFIEKISVTIYWILSGANNNIVTIN